MYKVLDSFECVEPELARRLGSIPPESLDDEMRGQLADHLEICHACRQQHRFERVVADLMAGDDFAGAAAGRQTVPHGRPNRSSHYPLAAALALAAGLLLAIVMGPADNPVPGLNRITAPHRSGDGDFRIVRPLEREVLLTRGGELNWTPLEGASSYRIQVYGMDGRFRWSDRTETTRIDLPDSGGDRGQYLAVIKPLPEDLTPEGERSVYFRRAGLGSLLLYRALHLPLVSLLLIMAGLTSAILAVVRRPL